MKLLLDANVSWRLTSMLKDHFGECVIIQEFLESEKHGLLEIF